MNINDLVQFITGLVAENPALAHLVIFLISAGEAVFILGLFVPSTPVLLACGTLIGVGKLPFWPVFIFASLGAMAGDALSYWIGRKLEHRVKHIWPFNQHVRLVEQGEAFFHRHGGASVFIGRFIPGVKAVVPGVAGILGMNWVRFTLINCVSAFVWAAAHLIPSAALARGIADSGNLGPDIIPLVVTGAAVAVVAWYTAEFLLRRRGLSIPGALRGLVTRAKGGRPASKLRDEEP